jgi:DNA polymerase-3 subunit gamma/tau
LTDKVAHAYLFSGPRGTGKTSVARLIAKAVNCSEFSSTGDICDKCSNCNAINEGQFMDLIEIDAASNRGIEEIRALKDTINYLPTQGVKKIYIIDEVHMLTREALMRFLKPWKNPLYM